MNASKLSWVPFLFLLSCQSGQPGDTTSDELYQSRDFTPVDEFTSGIEGPAAAPDGSIYVVNFREEGTIGRVSKDGKSSLFVKLPEGSTGNGIRIDPHGDLLVADYTGHNVLKVELSSKKISVYAHNDQMNQPNDLAIAEDGTLFASDPNWQASTGQLWRIDTDGSTTLLEKDMGTTNGVEVSPDGKTLYVNESVQRKVWAYDLSPSGAISNKRLLIEFPDFGLDGMRCDKEGNLYITRHGKGTVAVVSPEGNLFREVQLTGKKPSNITFGGPDGKTCFVTLQDRGCLEAFRTGKDHN
jgi:gluconolactonase